MTKIVIHIHQEEDSKTPKMSTKTIKATPLSLHEEESCIEELRSHGHSMAPQLCHGYSDYLEKNGHHFNNKLLNFACSIMENRNNQDHSWSTTEVETIIKSVGLPLENVCLCDLTYLANMYYADLYGSSIAKENLCIRIAYDIITDPDGYDGKEFKRWVTDMEGKNLAIEWSAFI